LAHLEALGAVFFECGIGGTFGCELAFFEAQAIGAYVAKIIIFLALSKIDEALFVSA
jgi:hypothetical protein